MKKTCANCKKSRSIKSTMTMRFLVKSEGAPSYESFIFCLECIQKFRKEVPPIPSIKITNGLPNWNTLDKEKQEKIIGNMKARQL